MLGYIVTGFLCLTLLLLLIRDRKMELKQALEIVLDAGYQVNSKGWHAWRATVGRQDYMLLMFDDNSNPMNSTEETYPNTPEGRRDIADKLYRKTQPKVKASEASSGASQ